ncbi:putative oxidoreductase CzcO [Capillimicrobium parvum]|uniref:Oxidoreductase CzcO n=2 Tax=Capillimicrobium parvum TaxID=2884022 RepID=A0A9E7BZ44_9ACTN|nr:putative oxidoreductase CzcO [Capillimicrobium parvum]
MRTETVIIGAGQAGLALSRHLTARGHDHVVLERGRVGERWRSERWDSLSLLTPNWLNRLPYAVPLAHPDGFLDREGVIAYLESYSAGAPVRERTAVVRVSPTPDGYHVATDRGDWAARNVVIATGDCDVPRIPDAAATAPPSVHQLHASRYRRPEQLPDGGVLVVGAGPSGQQLAAELRRAGRDVALAVGRHARTPRTYRGRDIFAWLHALGQLDVHADDVPDLAAARRAPSLPVSGAAGGESLGLDHLARLGVVVTGRFLRFTERTALLADDLEHQLREADRRLYRTLARIDDHIERTGAPAEPAETLPSVSIRPGPERLALGTELRTVLWATGYGRAYPWLDVPVLDAAGELAHREGITAAPGLFAVGLRFQRTRKSHFLGGVGDDAAHIAAAIAEARCESRLARAA